MKFSKKAGHGALVTSATAMTIAISTAVPALAAPVVGPGSPVRMPVEGVKIAEGRHVGTPMCSLNVPGYIVDQNGNKQRVMLTAGHCASGDVESPDGDSRKIVGDFFVPTRDKGDVFLGHAKVGGNPIEDIDAVEEHPERILHYMFNTPDYAVIDVADGVETTSISDSVDENGQKHGEPVQVLRIQDARTLGPVEMSIDNIGQPICVDGMRSGRTCGYQLFRTRYGIWAVAANIDHGDSGGHAYNPDTQETIGIVSMGVGPFSRYQPADVALEETYGIPDGQVNERFQVEPSTKPHTEYRTVNEDMEFAQGSEPSKPKFTEGTPIEGTPVGDFIDQVTGKAGRAIPSDTPEGDPAGAPVGAPFGSPSLGDSPQLPLPSMAGAPVAGAVSISVNQAVGSANALLNQAGLPGLS